MSLAARPFLVMDYDILIIGGGMVGASLACALRPLPYRIGVVEAVAPGAPGQPSFDDRAIALSAGSRRIFKAMGLWPSLAPATTPIERIHISHRGHFGATRLAAAEERVPALGYVAEARMIGGALTDALARLPQAELLCPARLKEVRLAPEGARVSIEQEGVTRDVSARLVVAADGGGSKTRALVGAKTFRSGYGQTAVVANVIGDRPHAGVAYERFTADGPVALLPFSVSEHAAEALPQRWGLVWTVPEAEADGVLGLDDEQFLAALQDHFGHRAGTFLKVGPRSAYPLALQFVRDQVRARLVLIGNAAHTVHPVAGQGFNLGLRDVAALAEVLAVASKRGTDPGSLRTLKDYFRWRAPDYARVLGLTDGLVRLFSNDLAPLAALRGLGMMALDLMPFARHRFARETMGLAGPLPRLARGMPLASENVREAPHE